MVHGVAKMGVTEQLHTNKKFVAPPNPWKQGWRETVTGRSCDLCGETSR